MKKTGAFILFVFLFASMCLAVFANSNTNNAAEFSSTPNFDVAAKSAILIEANTGTVLYEKNVDTAYSPASVTKVMTLLLVMEAIEEEKINLNDKVLISENAASMGGSQVFLEEGETMTVDELLKCTVIASANDAAVALAEHVGGSVDMFVGLMNMRAKAMGLKNTFFENVTGLDDTTEYHLTSARDISLISRELIKYPIITQYASLWQDTIRNGEFTLTNTNRLVRYYDGCNGLKTGSTAKAGYCISASAKRDGMQLIAVVMGAETRDERNAIARSLLDFGFANYALYSIEETVLENIDVLGSKISSVPLYQSPFSIVVPKGDIKLVECEYQIPKSLKAPLIKNQSVGKVIYKLDNEKIGESNIIIKEDLEKMKFSDVFVLMLEKIFSF